MAETDLERILDALTQEREVLYETVRATIEKIAAVDLKIIRLREIIGGGQLLPIGIRPSTIEHPIGSARQVASPGQSPVGPAVLKTLEDHKNGISSKDLKAAVISATGRGVSSVAKTMTELQRAKKIQKRDDGKWELKATI